MASTDKIAAEGDEFKTFKDLIKEVHAKGICGQCGGCVSFCSASEFSAIKMGENGIPVFDNEENCVKCGLCYLICPQIDALNQELKEKFEWKFPIGKVRRIASARNTDPQIVEVATDGGVVTGILMYLLEKKLIDGVIASKKIAPFKRVAAIIKTKKELLDTVGTRVCDLTQMDQELGNYSTYSPISFELKKYMHKDILRLAVVGTPCQIHTIRKMQILGVIPAHIIKYMLGLFCTENFYFTEKTRKKFEEKHKFRFEDIKKMNLKEELSIYLKDGRVVRIPFSELDEIMRAACRACDDFSNEYADLSFGGLTSPEGYTTTILKTKTGEDIYYGALHSGYIEENEELNKQVEKSKMLVKIINFSKYKRKRAADFLKQVNREKNNS
ncbi:MAG: Coenzyme F420 hydrogenase/dehydrogenase, beta subunit C-terminal domain [Candidatus Helarchaeota archaeon]|nr:Coenzyme F420 hydrogenase/dehydrogenase, beta subunit C-terminal domain [Candidatus Helarchaeota archaeon]